MTRWTLAMLGALVVLCAFPGSGRATNPSPRPTTQHLLPRPNRPSFELQRWRRPPERPIRRWHHSGVSGRMDPHVVLRTLRLNIGRFRACYQAALLSEPTLSGRVVLRFKVARGGEVHDPSVTGIASLEPCLARAVSRIRFAAPPGGMPFIVAYPLVLTPSPTP